MNDRKLDELLARKKDVAGDWSRDTAEFTAAFWREAARGARRQGRPWRGWAAAAGLLLMVGAVLLWGDARRHRAVGYDGFDKVLSETVRLFGNDAAVFFVGNELLTGERDQTDRPDNFIAIALVGGGRTVKLTLACSDADAIAVDAPRFSGLIVASRCDDKTLVLDVELKIDGRVIRTAVPAVRSGKNCYAATMRT